MSTSREHHREQDIMTARWEAVPDALAERLAELLVKEGSLASYKCKPDFIAFEVVLTDGTLVSFDNDDYDGCTFQVTLPGGVATEVEYHDGNPTACGASIDYVEELADEPFEAVLDVVEMAKERA